MTGSDQSGHVAEQLHVERDDQRGDELCEALEPGGTDKITHLATTRCELDQRHARERQLKRKDHLTEDQKSRRSAVTLDAGHGDGGHDR